MKDKLNPRKHMLEYLISIMDDANNFSWTCSKVNHAFLLCHMKPGEMKDYSDILVIDWIRRANAQKHVPNTQTVGLGYSGSSKKYSKITKSMPCTYYNQGSCLQTKSYETKGGLVQAHLCFTFCNHWPYIFTYQN